MTSTTRRLTLVLLGLWVASVAYLTLTPAGYTPPLTWQSFVCIDCGILDGADIVRNWILFVPGGVLAAAVLGGRGAVALPIGLTVLVEFLQIGIPGRDTGLQDLLSNSLGGLTGVWVMRRGLKPLGQAVLGLAAALTFLAPTVLLVPTATPYELYGLWTPRFGNVVHYDGRVVDATVGEVSTPSRRVPEREALVEALLERAPVRLRFEVGYPPEFALAPVFQIKDQHRQDLLELHALHSDLILRGRNPARVLKLDQPDVRWHDAMAGLAPGDTVTLLVERGRDSVCMSLDHREQCHLAPSLGDGWGFILNLEGPPRWFRELMSLGWALGLGGLIGLATRSWRSALGVTATVALLGYVGSVLSPDVSPNLVHAGTFVLGGLVGAALREPVVWLWRAAKAT